MTLNYEIRPARPDAHVYELVMLAKGAMPAGETLCMARWIPGSYMLRNFSKSILALEASVDGHVTELLKLDTSTWQLPAVHQRLEIRLQVHAHEASVRAAWLDRERGFFNGTSVFPYLPARRDEAVRVRLERPSHAEGSAWRVATTLDAVAVDDAGFGEYQAANWDELIDHPVEMGDFDQLDFTACGVTHEMVLAGGARFDRERLAADLAKICQYQLELFGEPAPVPRYVFQVALTESGYGGLEHRASTALMASRKSLPSPALDDPLTDDYVGFLGLCSHEYFHTWNVKRLKPAVFEPYALSAESPTRLLWFFEGVTSYYDDLTLVRSGVISPEAYLKLLAKTLTRVQRGAGRHLQTVTDSSRDAWTKFYLQDENAPNAIVSYYAKGALIALCLDAWLREASEDQQSLDTFMRSLWSRWRETGAGLEEYEPEQRVADCAGSAVAARLNTALVTTEDLPLQDVLAHFGVELRWRCRRSGSDNGGLASDAVATAKPYLGASTRAVDGGLKLMQVMTGSPAEQAGLAPGDVLIAVNHYRVTESSLEDLLGRHIEDGEVSVHAFRDGVLRTSTLPIQTPPLDTAELSISDRQRAGKWLGAGVTTP